MSAMWAGMRKNDDHAHWNIQLADLSTGTESLTWGSPLKSTPTITPFAFDLYCKARCTVSRASSVPSLRFMANINLPGKVQTGFYSDRHMNDYNYNIKVLVQKGHSWQFGLQICNNFPQILWLSCYKHRSAVILWFEGMTLKNQHITLVWNPNKRNQPCMISQWRKKILPDSYIRDCVFSLLNSC